MVTVTVFVGLDPTSTFTQVVEAGTKVVGLKIIGEPPPPPLPPPIGLVLSENVTLPTLDDASTEIEPVVLELVKVVDALPFAFVFTVTVALELDKVPPFVVVTVKVTGTLATGLPLALVAMTSSGADAVLLGNSNCPLPDEMLSDEPAPCTPMIRLNTALPAVDVAMTEIGPKLLDAVYPIFARPLLPVIADAVVPPPVNNPDPTWK